jgi:hypothetical protein
MTIANGILPQDRQIYISGRIWHDILPKVDISPFLYALHDSINLSDFGKGLQRYYFSFILMPEGEQINLPYAHYDAERRIADVAVSVPYGDYEEKTTNRILMLENAYLQGIDRLAALNITEFDVKAFYQNVKKVFAAEGWYGKWLD